MPKYNRTQTSFLFGEWSPKAVGRFDLEEYAQGCELLLNNFLDLKGGSDRRPGTTHVLSQINSVNIPQGTRVFPAFINKNTRFLIFVAPSSTNVIARDIDSDTEYVKDMSGTAYTTGKFQSYTAAELKNVRWKVVGDRVYYCSANQPPWYALLPPIEINPFNLNDGIAFMWNEEIFNGEPFDPVPLAPNNNIVISRVEQQVKSWPFKPLPPFVSFTATGPGNEEPDTHATEQKLQASAATGSITLTGQIGAFAAGAAHIFHSGQIGTPFIFIDGNNYGIAVITGVTSEFIATASVVPNYPLPVTFTAAGGSALYRPAAWNDVNGWPSVVEFFENRLIFANNVSQPDTIWASQQGDVHEFTHVAGLTGSALANSDAVEFTFGTPEVNEIKWMRGQQNLVVGTSDNEHIIDAGFGASSVSAKPRSNRGSSDTDAIKFNNLIFFVEKDGVNISEFVFDFNEDSFKALTISTLADHFPSKHRDLFDTKPDAKIVDMQYQRSRSTIWILDDAGQIFLLTLKQDLGFVAFHDFKLGGVSNSDGDEPPIVTSMAIMPTADETYEDVYLIVERHIAGGTKVYLEKVNRPFLELGLLMDNTETSIASKPIYMDSCVMNQVASFPSGTPLNVHGGFGALEGQVADVFADGAYVGKVTVSSSNITLPDGLTAQEVIAGLTYTNIIKPLPINAGSALGDASGKPKRILKAFARFFKTMAAKVGLDTTDANAQEFDFHPQGTPADEAPEPLTVNHNRPFQGGKQKEIDLSAAVWNDLPLPMSLLGITLDGDVDD